MKPNTNWNEGKKTLRKPSKWHANHNHRLVLWLNCLRNKKWLSRQFWHLSDLSSIGKLNLTLTPHHTCYYYTDWNRHKCQVLKSNFIRSFAQFQVRSISIASISTLVASFGWCFHHRFIHLRYFFSLQKKAHVAINREHLMEWDSIIGIVILDGVVELNQLKNMKRKK